MTPRPDVRYGEGAILHTPRVVAERGAGRVLLVCGARSFDASGAARMLPELERVARVRRWSGFRPNTDAADLLDGLRLAGEYGPDLVLGVGGGSAMDMAKLLCAFAGITDQSTLHAAIRAGDPVTGRNPALVLAPTTSGSGSEATHFAVVYIAERKFSVGGPALRPDVTLLDPALTRSGSPYQRATSGIDAVAQAIESLWAAGGTDRSRRWARHALRLMLPAIEGHVLDPAPVTARAMAIGSHLAGRAIDISRTTGAHALSYAITKGHGVSHGHAVALTLGAFLDAHGRVEPERLQPGLSPECHRASMREVYQALGASGPGEARDRFVALARRLGLPMELSQVGVGTPEQRAAIVDAVNVERLGNNPVRFTTTELVGLLS